MIIRKQGINIHTRNGICIAGSGNYLSPRPVSSHSISEIILFRSDSPNSSSVSPLCMLPIPQKRADGGEARGGSRDPLDLYRGGHPIDKCVLKEYYGWSDEGIQPRSFI